MLGHSENHVEYMANGIARTLYYSNSQTTLRIYEATNPVWV